MGAIPATPIVLRAGDTLPERRIGPLTPSVFAMGLLHAGMLGLQLARWVGPEALRSYAVRFTGQVWPGDVLTFSGRVLAIDADGLAALELEVARQDGDVVLTALATAVAAPA